MSNLTVISDDRQPVSDADLDMMVQGEVNILTSKKDTFTAYSVTLAMRNAYPKLEIDHERVRPLVHSMMYFNSDYDSILQAWNGVLAVTYAPIQHANVAIHPLVAASPVTPQLPAVGTKVDWED